MPDPARSARGVRDRYRANFREVTEDLGETLARRRSERDSTALALDETQDGLVVTQCPDAVALRRQRTEGVIAAALLFLLFGPVTTYLTNWALSAYMPVRLGVALAVGVSGVLVLAGHVFIRPSADGTWLPPRGFVVFWGGLVFVGLISLFFLRSVLQGQESTDGLTLELMLELALRAEGKAFIYGTVASVTWGLALEIAVAVSGGIAWSALSFAIPLLALLEREEDLLAELRILDADIATLETRVQRRRDHPGGLFDERPLSRAASTNGGVE